MKTKWRIDLNRITDKVVMMVLIFLMVLGVLAVTIFSQNQSTRQVLTDIREIRIPVPITTADIISGANRVSASQRAYLMTGNDEYKRERLQIWDQQIKPAVQKLMKLREKMRMEEHKKAVDEAIIKVEAYENVQDKIDAFFDKELKTLSLEISSQDSTNFSTIIAKVQRKERLEKELDHMISGEASSLRKDIREALMPLNKAQEQLLFKDSDQVEANVSTANITLISVSLVAGGIVVILAYILIKSLRKSIQKPTSLLEVLSKGELPKDESTSHDELNEIIQAANTLSTSQFALEIGDGKFNHDFTPASQNDVLGNSLIQMRDRLRTVSEEDKKTNWFNNGMAQLGDILRKDTDDAEQLYGDIMSFTVKYLNANQGAMFLLSEENENKEKTLNLAACYAYGRKKFTQASFIPGEGIRSGLPGTRSDFTERSIS